MKQVPATVSQIVERALGATVAQCVSPQTGAVAETYLLHLRDGQRDCPAKVVCKIGSDNIWTGEVIEPEVTRFVGQHTSLPVPALIASGSVQTGAGTRRWGLYEYLDGSVPHTFELQAYEPVVHQAGQLLGQLHKAFCFDSTGEFTREAGELAITPPASKNLVARLPFRAELPQPVFAHGDYHPRNLLIESGSITAVLDWGNAHISDAGYSLARAEARFIDVPPVRKKAVLRQRFREGYEQNAPMPYSYTRRAKQLQLLWLVQSAINLGSVAKTPHGSVQLRRQTRNWLSRQSNRIEKLCDNWS